MLLALMRCPCCGHRGELEAQLRVGALQFVTYRANDRVAWLPRKAVRNGGRPPGGDLDATAFAECRECDAFFSVVVEIRADQLRGVRPGSERLV